MCEYLCALIDDGNLSESDVPGYIIWSVLGVSIRKDKTRRAVKISSGYHNKQWKPRSGTKIKLTFRGDCLFNRLTQTNLRKSTVLNSYSSIKRIKVLFIIPLEIFLR